MLAQVIVCLHRWWYACTGNSMLAQVVVCLHRYNGMLAQVIVCLHRYNGMLAQVAVCLHRYNGMLAQVVCLHRWWYACTGGGMLAYACLYWYGSMLAHISSGVLE